MPTIEIQDRDDDGPLSFDLLAVLDLLEPFKDDLQWYLVEFEPWLLLGEDGTRNQPPPPWVSSLFQDLKSSQRAMQLEWETLKALARYIGQTENLVLIGNQKGEAPSEGPSGVDRSEHSVTVKAFDASLWTVTSRDEALIEAVKRRFKRTTIVEEAGQA